MKATESSLDSGQKADKYLKPHSAHILRGVIFGVGVSWIGYGAKLGCGSLGWSPKGT